MKFGMNLLLWTDDPCQEEWLPLCRRLKEMGFDGVELPIFSGDPDSYAELGRRLADLGLECTAITVRNAEDDPISQDQKVRRAAVEATKRAIDCTQAAGGKLLGGPLYAALGCFSGAPPTEEEWAHAVEYMAEVAAYAESADCELAVECLNRFEIYLLNCVADGARFVREVDRSNVGLHYDTFHANIEEKDVGAAIREAAGEIRHVHISENDRGTPGRGQVRWAETFDALVGIDYQGWLTIEAFGQALPALAAATRIWRPLFEDEEQLARDGLVFMREAWQSRVDHR